MTQIPAIIPAAGEGSRLRPITRFVSKPMLPVGDTPVIQFSLDEALQAGCSPVVVVTSPDDTALKQYIKGKKERFDKIFCVDQPNALGLGEALYRGFNALKSPIQTAAIIPDNVLFRDSGIGSLIERTSRDEQLVFATVDVTREEAKYFGNSGGFELRRKKNDGDIPRISTLQEKQAGTFLESSDSWPASRTVPRYLLGSRFFELVDQQEPDPETGEIDEVPILRQMLESMDAAAVPIDAEVYDMGNTNRYLRLCADFYERFEKANENV